MCQLFIIDYCIEACRLREKRRSARALDSSPLRKVGQKCGVTDVKALLGLKAATRQDECPSDDQGPLCPRAVDKGADRRMRHNADEATGREHGADRGLAPLCLCEQEDVHIGAEAAAHIGEEEIEPVQSIQPYARDQSISLHPLHALKGESKTTGVAPGTAVPIAAKDARGKRGLIAAEGSSSTWVRTGSRLLSSACL